LRVFVGPLINKRVRWRKVVHLATKSVFLL